MGGLVDSQLARIAWALFSLSLHIVGGPTGCLSGHQGPIVPTVADANISHFIKDALGVSEHYRSSEVSAKAWPGRKAGTDQSTTVLRPWLREFQKDFRPAKPGRIAPGGTVSKTEGIRPRP